MKTCVVIPAYNEGSKILDVLENTKSLADIIILVDDGSDQKKMAEINFNNIGDRIIYLRHRINLGKGAALKTGCEAAIKLGADVIVLMDADGQHNPEDITRFVDKLHKENLDVVFGTRQLGKNMPIMMMLGNKFLSLTTYLLFGIYIADTQSGFRAFRASAYPKIKWNSTRYSVETEMIVKAAKNGLKFNQINIQTIYHDRYKGTTIFDGLRIFFNMLIWKLI